jgi:hypothetical protein
MMIDPIGPLVQKFYGLTGRGAVPLCCVYVSVVSQLFFCLVRINRYQRMKDGDNSLSDLQQRNLVIGYFLAVETLQTVGYLYLSFKSRWCLLSTAYSLGHLVWTAVSFNKEYRDYDGYHSMDGWIRLKRR